MNKLILLTGVAILSFGTISEALATISCVFSNSGKNLEIVAGKEDYFMGTDSAYRGCGSTNSISSDDWTYNTNWKNNVENLTYTGKSLGSKSFKDATNLKTVVINEGTQSIDSSAFENTNIESISLPSTLTHIGADSFNSTKKLTDITMPDSVKYIGRYAFYGSGITSITIPKSVTTISDSAFRTKSLTNVTFESGSQLKEIEQQAFEGTKIESIDIPEGVTSIGVSVFEDAKGLKTITLPSTLKSIGSRAFYSTSELESITIPEGITTLGYGTFWESGIKSIDLPSTLTSIGGAAFHGAKNLTNITIPDSVTSIGSFAFAECYELEILNLPTNAEIGMRLFGDTGCGKPKTVVINENVNTSKWSNQIFEKVYGCIGKFECVDDSGNKSESDTKCIASLSKYITDEYGRCQSGVYCISSQKIGDTCVGVYIEYNGKCETISYCKRRGMLANIDDRQCMNYSDCKGMYIIDRVNKKCKKLPGCGTFADGKCTNCTEGYLINSEGTCTPEADCKNGLHKTADGGCAANDDVNCNTQEGNKCTECKGGYLEQSGSCVTSCGAGYKQIENWCNRIRYTPAEAAPLLNDDNNTVTITFRK